MPAPGYPRCGSLQSEQTGSSALPREVSTPRRTVCPKPFSLACALQPTTHLSSLSPPSPGTAHLSCLLPHSRPRLLQHNCCSAVVRGVPHSLFRSTGAAEASLNISDATSLRHERIWVSSNKWGRGNRQASKLSLLFLCAGHQRPPSAPVLDTGLAGPAWVRLKHVHHRTHTGAQWVAGRTSTCCLITLPAEEDLRPRAGSRFSQAIYRPPCYAQLTRLRAEEAQGLVLGARRQHL